MRKFIEKESSDEEMGVGTSSAVQCTSSLEGVLNS